MDTELENGEVEISESLEDQPQGGKLKRRKREFKLYGDDWDGDFMKVAEMASLIPSFKEYYFLCRRADMKASAIQIVIDFNEKIRPLRFYPYPTQYQSWRKKWDRQMLLELGFEETRIAEAKRIRDVVKVRDEERAVTLVPSEDELEGGIKTLGGMLVNDAVSMLQDDKELEDLYTSDEMVKRKTYALNVFAHVTRHVQGKEALKIKKHAEGRETAGFLMNLLNRAKAGKVSESDMAVLENAVTVDATPSQ